VELAIHQMAPLKAPGPDGFNACFYQKNWELIGGEVCNAVISTLNLGVINKEINSTYIALIPKSKNPICVTDYRPISLCNVIYKLISKVLANRLKEVLPTIISPYQSAFIPGRLITDNILAAYETLHTMHSRMYGKKGFMAVKVDMSKAYDRGLPALVGKSRTKEFKSIIDRIEKRLKDWKLKFLSQAGKEVLLKAVVQAIPTYCMSVFLLPKALSLAINSMMKNFWWGHMSNNSRIHWMSWGRMGLNKEKGGMGFREFSCFNKAMLAKQYWRLWNSPDSLVSRIMKAKYFPSCDVMEANLGSKPSYAWRSIFSSKYILEEGLYWRIGNGEKTRIWGEKWVPLPNSFTIHSPPSNGNEEMRVCDLIDKNLGWWDQNMLKNMFREEEIKAINSIPLSSTNQQDKKIWRGTANGLFSVKSAYHLAKEIEDRQTAECSMGLQNSDVWKLIWKLKVPNVEKNFIWRACHDILPTRDNLVRRKVLTDPSCPICGLEAETPIHLL
jgi:hypothetical protein